MKNIKWSKGFFRLWIIYGAIVIGGTALYIYLDNNYLSPKTLVYSPKIKAFKDYSNWEEKKYFDEGIKRGLITTFKIDTDILGFINDPKDKSKNYKNLALNDETGEILYLTSTNIWSLAETAYNKKTKETAALIDSKWVIIKNNLLNDLKIIEYRKYYKNLYETQLFNFRKDSILWGLTLLLSPLIMGFCIKWIYQGFR